MYNIGQVAEMVDLPVSTLRYYDKQGLFPKLKRDSGIRKFSEKELNTLRMIECLKKSGLEIRDIRRFMEWCEEGPSTFEQRRELLETQKAHVEEEIRNMNKTLDMLSYKCWFYEQAIRDGSDEPVRAMTPDQMPEEIRRAYENSHRD